MTSTEIFRSDRFRATVCRGDSLSIVASRWVNSGGACGPIVKGEPTSLAGYTLAASARALGTNRVVPITTAIQFEGSATEAARFSVYISPEDLGFAFEEDALQAIDVRVEARRVNTSITLMKGVIKVKNSASQVGA